MANILLLGAGTQSLAILPSLHKSRHTIVILTGVHPNYGDKSRYVNKVYRYEPLSENEYINQILNIVSSERIQVILPMGDDSAIILSKYKNLFEAQNVKMPSFKNFINGYDKNRLMTLCRNNGYPHPTTIDLSKTPHDSVDVKNFKFPAMLKPNCTTGGRGMILVNNYDEFVSSYPTLHATYGDYHLQQCIKPGGRLVKVQLYVNERQELVASSVMQKLRWYPNKAGSNCCAVSIKNDEIIKICHQVLKDLNWIGFADFDTIEDPDTGELLIMEINPRLPACIKNAIVAGVDWGEILVNDALGIPQNKYSFKEGMILRNLGLDILWWKNSDNKWHTKPCWFKFFGKNIRYQDMSSATDPVPFISGTFNNIKKLFNPDFKKLKQI